MKFEDNVVSVVSEMPTNNSTLPSRSPPNTLVDEPIIWQRFEVREDSQYPANAHFLTSKASGNGKVS